MLEAQIDRIYAFFRLAHYRNLFNTIKEKAGSLTATEAFSAEAIYLLGCPTIKTFADFLGISQPNATYKINALIEKGYLKKTTSDDDRRESRLAVTEKFIGYYGTRAQYLTGICNEIKAALTADEELVLEGLLKKIADKLS